jgi:glycosyltransferase involved in cell wall biosynthesis
LPELVKDEENGFLVDGLNPEEMATAVLKIINDSNLQRKFSLKSKEIIASHDINQVYPLLKNIYEESFKNSFKKNRVEEENL